MLKGTVSPGQAHVKWAILGQFEFRATYVLIRVMKPKGQNLSILLWEDVAHTCSSQRLFCSETCIESWLMRTRSQRGYIMDLATLWRLAARWYSGRLNYGYVRREPSEAAQYLRDVGLHGAFWGH